MFSLLLAATLGLSSPLRWAARVQKAEPPVGATQVHFDFAFVNAGGAPVEIQSAQPSCGCTTAHVPSLPWTIPVGGSGTIGVDVDLRGKYGRLNKGVRVALRGVPERAWPELVMEIDAPELLSMDPALAARAVKAAAANRQAVFAGECVRCHAPAGAAEMPPRAQYAAYCGVCHDSARRAAMVPDLRRPPAGLRRDAAYWTQMIAAGKPGTLMPAFSAAQGGPLDDEAIRKLAAQLAHGIPWPVRPGPEDE